MFYELLETLQKCQSYNYNTLPGNTGTMTEALQIAKFNCDRVSHTLLQTLSKSHSVNIPTSTVEQLSK